MQPSPDRPTLRDELATPALVIDLPAFERNMRAMANWARDKSLALRPHAKTHKSAEIARRQIAVGAVGICCAKLGEAEALAAEGLSDILVTSPLTSAATVRAARLAGAMERLILVVDHPDQVARLRAAAGQVEVMVDIDTGSHRTGVTSAAAAVSLARLIADSPNLTYRGVQYYCGTLQHVGSQAARRQALAERRDHLLHFLEALAEADLAPPVVTGAGTGSFEIEAELGLLNEFQPGSYLFMDRQYAALEPVGLRFEQALFIDSRVISANVPGLATIDAGLKAMATEAGPPLVVEGAGPGTLYRFMGDEHGMLTLAAGAQHLPLDRRLVLVPPHCDPTVNLYDFYAVCEGERVVGFWPISARGRSA